ncbi:MBL fold metallo-hydrolase [Herbaspirillum sp. HC18]|nr:MBL fold metallo-hydrolase [Herbaspirillum sp. HC18]
MTSNRCMHVEGFFDPVTRTVSYLLLDKGTRLCAVIDSVLGFEPKSGRIVTTPTDRLIARVHELGATVQWILETHAHVDHLSAARYIKQKLGGKTGIGEPIVAVQRMLGESGDAGLAQEGRCFEHLFFDDERFCVGTLQCRAMHTPGHTPACVTYVVSDYSEIAAFVGDTLLMPDCGTARCDSPGGNARSLYRSINRVLSLPEQTMLFVCHDYPPAGREPQFVTTVAQERESNIHVRDGISEEQFVALCKARDAVLDLQKLSEPSVRVKLCAGVIPASLTPSASCEPQPDSSEDRSSERSWYRRP